MSRCTFAAIFLCVLIFTIANTSSYMKYVKIFYNLFDPDIVLGCTLVMAYLLEANYNLVVLGPQHPRLHGLEKSHSFSKGRGRSPILETPFARFLMLAIFSAFSW